MTCIHPYATWFLYRLLDLFIVQIEAQPGSYSARLASKQFFFQRYVSITNVTSNYRVIRRT